MRAHSDEIATVMVSVEPTPDIVCGNGTSKPSENAGNLQRTGKVNVIGRWRTARSRAAAGGSSKSDTSTLE
jgi:hypothetical protein